MAKKVKTEASELTKALGFIACAQHEIGQSHETHFRLFPDRLYAADGTLTASYPINVGEINIPGLGVAVGCPLFARFRDALAACKETATLHGLNGKLCIQDGAGFRALVPCLTNRDVIAIVEPDRLVMPIGPSIRDALITAGKLASDSAQEMLCASVWLRPRTAVGTNRTAMLEYWHGFDLPPEGFVIPKTAINALAKLAEYPTAIGFCETSLTFFFENGAWLKTQLYSEKWPVSSTDKLLNFNVNALPLTPDFFPTVKKLKKFVEGNLLYADTREMYTEIAVDAGVMQAIVIGLTENFTQTFNIKDLLLLEEHIKLLEPRASNGHAYFFGNNLRGVLVGQARSVARVMPCEDDDIPF